MVQTSRHDTTEKPPRARLRISDYKERQIVRTARVNKLVSAKCWNLRILEQLLRPRLVEIKPRSHGGKLERVCNVNEEMRSKNIT